MADQAVETPEQEQAASRRPLRNRIQTLSPEEALVEVGKLLAGSARELEQIGLELGHGPERPVLMQAVQGVGLDLSELSLELQE